MDMGLAVLAVLVAVLVLVRAMRPGCALRCAVGLRGVELEASQAPESPPS